ncbi:hypothetical protein H0H81_005050, partial [Sphagnurus paluster]
MTLPCGAPGCSSELLSVGGQTLHRKNYQLWCTDESRRGALRRERAAAQSAKKAQKLKGKKKKNGPEAIADVYMGEPSNTHSDCPPLLTVQLPPPSPPPPPPQEFTQTGRLRCNYTLPRRYQDILPVPPPPPALEDEPEAPQTSLLPQPHLTFENAPQASLFGYLSQAPPWPFKNMSTWLFMNYFNSGSATKSAAEANHLVHDVLQHPEFDAASLGSDFDALRENHQLDNALKNSESSPFLRQFTSQLIEIDIPSGKKDVPSTKFAVPGLLYRKLTSVIEAAFHDPLAHRQEERVMGEIYTSDAFIHEHDLVQRCSPVPPDDPGCKREKVVVAVMFSSDGTHLANFGTAKAWPIYFMVGNLSKYFRGLPNSGAMHHLAYIPSLPDSFQDVASKVHANWKTQKKNITTHCQRELMHAVWDFLFDDDFIHAYKYGMVIMCADGIERQVYPRLFTYSADYPEKVLLVTICDKGLCPCPRCLVQKSMLDRLGLARDSTVRSKLWEFVKEKVTLARHIIYNLRQSITGTRVKELLKNISAVPTMNAFASKLSTVDTSFNTSKMLVVDLLHEFELGVWRTLFKHLIRLLYAASPQGNLVAELDLRYI